MGWGTQQESLIAGLHGHCWWMVMLPRRHSCVARPATLPPRTINGLWHLTAIWLAALFGGRQGSSRGRRQPNAEVRLADDSVRDLDGRSCLRHDLRHSVGEV